MTIANSNRITVSLRRALLAVLVLLTAIIALAVTKVGAVQTQEPLVIGVLPNVSARVIFTNYQPMRQYFEKELGRPVEIATAADFPSFSANTMKGDYQLVVTAANVARVNQKDGAWEPVAIYEPDIPALLVSGVDNNNASVDQLRGKLLAVANSKSLVVLRGLKWLSEQGLQEGKDYKLTRTVNEDSLGALISSGEAPFAMMSMPEFRSISEKTRQNLKIWKEYARVKPFVVMANPKLPAEEKQRLKTLMLAFPQSEEGKNFFALTMVKNIKDVSESDLQSLDDYVDQTREGLKNKN